MCSERPEKTLHLHPERSVGLAQAGEGEGSVGESLGSMIKCPNSKTSYKDQENSNFFLFESGKIRLTAEIREQKHQ